MGRQITVHSILALWDDLHQNYSLEHLLSHRLSPDTVRSMFRELQQVQGHNGLPSTVRFLECSKGNLVDRVTKIPSGVKTEANMAEVLNELLHLPVSSVASVPCEPPSLKGAAVG